MVRMDRSEQVRSSLSVRGEDTLVRSDQEREGAKENAIYRAAALYAWCATYLIFFYIHYLIFKTVTTLI